MLNGQECAFVRALKLSTLDRLPLINKPLEQFFQIQLAQDLFQPFLRIFSWRAFVAGDDQFVLHRMLPADQFCHGHLIAMCFQQQAAQDIGEVAAEFAGVDRMPPDFRERSFAE